MAWSTIRLELARNREFPEGSRLHGYLLHAPLDRNGRVDLREFEAGASRATVEEFWGDRDTKHGRLVHRGRHLWTFSFGETGEEPIFHFGDHCFIPGEYLTVRDLSGLDHTFRVTTITRSTANAELSSS